MANRQDDGSRHLDAADEEPMPRMERVLELGRTELRTLRSRGAAAVVAGLLVLLGSAACEAPETEAEAEELLIAVGGENPGGLAVLRGPPFTPIVEVEDGLGDVHGAAVSSDGELAYAMNLGDAERAVTVVDVGAGEPVDVVSLPAPTHHAAFSAQEQRLYVDFGSMQPDPDVPTGVASLPREGGEPEIVETEGAPHYVALGPKETRLYVAVRHPNRLLILDVPELEPVGSVELDGPPDYLEVGAEGDVVFATLAEEVVRIDPERLEVEGRAPAGPDAHAVALAGCCPDYEFLYVGNRAPGTVTVVDPESMEVIETAELETGMLTHLHALPDGSLLASAGEARELWHLAPPGSLATEHRAELSFVPHQIATTAPPEHNP